MLVRVAAGLLGLGTRLGRPLLRRGRPLLRLGDELLGRGLGGGQSLGFLPFGFFPARRELDLEFGLGLRALRFALLEKPLGLAPHLVSLALGRAEDLVALPLGRGLELGHFTLGRGPQLGDVTFHCRALLSDLVVRRRPQLGHLALGRRGQLIRLAPCACPDGVGLTLGRATLVVGLALGDRPQFGRLVFSGGPHLGGVHLRRGLDLVGLGPGRLDQFGGLFLGQPEQLLDPRAQAGVGGAFLLLELPVSLSQLPVHRLDLILVLAHLPLKLGEMLVDLLGVVAAHHLGELARLAVFKEIGELSVNVGLHVA